MNTADFRWLWRNIFMYLDMAIVILLFWLVYIKAGWIWLALMVVGVFWTGNESLKDDRRYRR